MGEPLIEEGDEGEEEVEGEAAAAAGAAAPCHAGDLLMSCRGERWTDSSDREMIVTDVGVPG